MIYLGVDYGLAKIGLSLSEGELAEPLEVLRIKTPEEALVKIRSLAEINNVEKIIIGIPYPDSIGAKKFAAKLAEEVKLPVISRDETMTTSLAIKTKKKARQNEDSFAAAILLEGYLEEEKGASLGV